MLHDLGVVVAHGFDRDAPAVRREVNLLDPNWLTGAVYRILTSAQLVQQNGELAREQLGELLEDHKTYPEDRHEFILDMMQDSDIGLCLKLPGTDPPRYLVPEGLHDEGPYYEDLWDDSLRFRYTYQLLPRSLMPRFIVESHREAVQQTTRWLTGVVLQASGCEILVEADLDQKQIDIRVKGPGKLRRAALHVALTHLKHVHALNRDLGQEACVPLPDDPDVSVAYDHLLDLESDSEAGPDYRFRPEGAKRFYTVTELLEGVRQEPRPERPPRPRPGVDGAVPEPRANEPSWNKVTIASALVVVLLFVAVWLIPSLKGKAILGGLAAVAALTAYFVRGLNPLLYYRRRITATIAGGFIAAPLNFALQVGRQRYPDLWWLQFDGRLSDWFYLAWALIVVGLIWADVQQRRGRRD